MMLMTGQICVTKAAIYKYRNKNKVFFINRYDSLYKVKL